MNPIDFEAICFVNNSISSRLAREAIVADGIDFKRVALIKLRSLKVDWEAACGYVLDYGSKPSLNFFGQYRFIGFYLKASVFLRRALKSPRLKEVYICNNDNLLCGHVLQVRSNEAVRVSVLAEGIMNYQDIGLKDRAWWRWLAKPAIGFFMGLKYKTPSTHLSGAYESGVDRVFSFSAPGLKAPEQKVVIFPFLPVSPSLNPDLNSVIIVHTGLWQWMPAKSYSIFASSFVQWLHKQGFKRVFAKNHPHISTGVLEAMLPEAEVLGINGAIESIADRLPAGTVVGTCCTALGTLKLIRPDLRCVDYGADYYCKYAYHGDYGVVEFLRGCGVEVVFSDLDESGGKLIEENREIVC